MAAGPTGVLLINLGTPEATDFRAMRRYLKEFLSDKRVVEAKGPLWWLILNGVILTRKPKSSGAAYRKIWNEARDESPLKTITRAQAEALATRYSDHPDIQVDWAMRYGKPSIPEAIARLTARGCTRLLVLPLYPQYSAATTATAMDQVFDALKTMRHQPTLRMVPPYFEHPAYIAALADSITSHLAELPWQPEAIIASLHGLPQAFIERGDPYQAQCETTARLLGAALKRNLRLCYQSRSGRAPWVGPDTEQTLIDLARAGTRDVVVVAPGFAADCVETLEELEIRAAAAFRAHGGRNFSVVPALNASAASVEMLHSLSRQNLAGWT